MRYPAGQKQETHKHIVAVAAREFRARGLQGIGISDLMAQAGLTQGGFYAHFKNRDALVAEATQAAAEQSLRKLEDAAASAPGREVEAMLDFYLSLGHRDDPGHGCLLPTLSTELSRQNSEVRHAFTESLKANMLRVSRFMPGKSSEQKGEQAIAFISSMAGGLMIARTINDPNLSEAMLKALKKQLRDTYAPICK